MINKKTVVLCVIGTCEIWCKKINKAKYYVTKHI